MKHVCITLALAILFLAACTKETPIVNGSHVSESEQIPLDNRHNTIRLSGTNYSHSLPVDSANRMLMSYLHSVGYPGVDTALRSLSFDADTLRAYLQNPNITTVKFMIAHKSTFINSGNEGTNAGMSPSGLTIIIAGLNNNDEYVLNTSNGVYDNMINCPHICAGTSSALIQ